MATRLSRYEMETVITFNAEGKTANIYSTDPVWIRKIKELEGAREHSIGWEVDVPKKWVRIQRPPRVSEETKKKRLVSLQKARQSRRILDADGTKKA